MSETPRPLEPEWSARMEAARKAAREARVRAPGEHTITVEVALEWENHGRLGELLAALDAGIELVGPAVGADVSRRVIGVTVTVKARTETAAQEIATEAVLDEMVMLGLV